MHLDKYVSRHGRIIATLVSIMVSWPLLGGPNRKAESLIIHDVLSCLVLLLLELSCKLIFRAIYMHQNQKRDWILPSGVQDCGVQSTINRHFHSHTETEK